MLIRVAIALLLLILAPSAALAQKRVALVIGIDKYDNLDPRAQLQKARSDGKAIADTFKALGFDVIHKDDVTRSTFNGHWQDFLNKLTPGDTAAFYFAGHGVELGGRNYLLPRDIPSVRPGRDELLKRESLSVQEFLADLREKGTRLNLVILDACRDNPFDQVAGRSVGSARGLAVTEPPEGTFIMFSAGWGESALDRVDDKDANPNSVYTRHLLPLLRAPGLSLTEVAEQVRVVVRQSAAEVQHRQTPAYYNQVLGRVCLAVSGCDSQGASAPAPALPAQPSRTEVAQFCQAIGTNPSIAVVQTLMETYKGSAMAACAQARLDELKRGLAPAPAKTASSAAAVSPPRCEGIETVVLKERRCLKPKEVFRECSDCPEMVVIPAGEFMMGSNDGDPDEKPLHKVLITKPYAAGKFEVTFAEWGACVAAGACKHEPSDSNWGRGTRPVINVSWDDITKEYLPWLSRKTGKEYRLLTEAEWEYAARAGSGAKYTWGDTIGRTRANCGGCGSRFDDKQTAPVGLFQPNAFGLQDVHGNVGEWAADCYNDSYQSAPADGSAWTSGDCQLRLVRGGSWASYPNLVRAAFRAKFATGSRVNYIGFRVARTLD